MKFSSAYTNGFLHHFSSILGNWKENDMLDFFLISGED